MPSSLAHALFFTLFLVPRAAAGPTFPPDAAALLAFKSLADLDNRLLFSLTERFDFCQWRGVKCFRSRVVRLYLPTSSLRGSLAADSLSRLASLRVLSLANNSLSGPIPDLSPLTNLKSLLLAGNSFAGAFPPSILSLRRLTVLDLARNNFSGPIPVQITGLDRLVSLRLELNRFSGSLPALNQSLLSALDVSGNNLSGPVPATQALSRFGPGSFSGNPRLCGEVVNLPCNSPSPFFSSGPAGTPARPEIRPPLEQSVVLSPAAPAKNHKKTGLILGLAIAIAIVIAAALFLFTAIRARIRVRAASMPAEKPAIEAEPEAKEEVRRAHQSGRLVFSPGEAELYGLEQLMRASAELLGRGIVGTTYKAVLDSGLVVTVKRLDAAKTAATAAEAFERHMEAVGGLRHPNLVPVRAFFQAKGERLIIFDYHPNGSLFNLIHGSRSTRAKALHWTSCLKIAEDVAQGLAYIHNVSKLIHGNLKSSNVLLGADFEACLTDYGLAALADSWAHEDPDSAGYRAPEVRKSTRRGNAKADVYAFGALLLELLTGKHPSQHPFLVPTEVPEWVRATREDGGGAGGGGEEEGQLGMLIEVACICSVTSPEQRPAMWQVLRMIQEIKESVVGTKHNNGLSGFS